MSDSLAGEKVVFQKYESTGRPRARAVRRLWSLDDVPGRYSKALGAAFPCGFPPPSQQVREFLRAERADEDVEGKYCSDEDLSEDDSPPEGYVRVGDVLKPSVPLCDPSVDSAPDSDYSSRDGSMFEPGRGRSPHFSSGAIAGSLNIATNLESSASDVLPKVGIVAPAHSGSHIRRFASYCHSKLDRVSCSVERTWDAVKLRANLSNTVFDWCLWLFSVLFTVCSILFLGGYWLVGSVYFAARRVKFVAGIYRSAVILYRGYSWGANCLVRAKGAVKRWYDKEWETKVIVCGFPIPRITFFAIALFISLMLCIVIYASVSLRPKKSKEKELEEERLLRSRMGEVELQAGLSDWFTDNRKRALLNVSLFVTSLVSFGNLKWFRAWSPMVSFLGWVGQLLPTDLECQGCSKAPHCSMQKAHGEYVCSACAATQAARALDNPRFSGPNKFNPEQSYAALCEDILTKADISWFVSAGSELQNAIIRDEEILADIKSGNVCIHIDAFQGKPFVKSRRDPLTIALLSHKKMFVSAGLMNPNPPLDKADVTSPDLGVGYRAVQGEEKENGEGFVPLSQSNDGGQGDYFLFLKNGVWSVWLEVPIVINNWTYRFKTWKNCHPVLSSAADLMLIMISMFITYLVLTASYDKMCSLWCWMFKSNTGIDVDSIEPEGRGVKSRFVKKAEGAGRFKERHQPEISAAVWHRDLARRDNPNVAVVEKIKNYIIYDFSDIEKNLPMGFEMVNPDNRDRIVVKTKEEYDSLRNAGWQPVSSTFKLKTNPQAHIPLEKYRANPQAMSAFKVLQWTYTMDKQGKETRIRLTRPQREFLNSVMDNDPYNGNVSPGFRKLVDRASRLSTDEPSSGEKRLFYEFVSGDVVIDELEFESNVQTLSTRECPYEANGMRCRVKGCVRMHKTAQSAENIRLEALLHPEPRPVDLGVVFNIVVLQGGEKIKQGTAFSGPYGFYSARHVFYGVTSDLLFPLDRFRLVSRTGEEYFIEPRTLCAPRDDQLSPGQCSDFVKFRTTDPEFNVKSQQCRVSFRNWTGDEKEVRNLRFVPGYHDPVFGTGSVTVVDRQTGMCRYTCNSMPSDSGSPVFDMHGHCIGLHRGYIGSANENVFVLIYPQGLVSWFVQSEPKNA